MYLIRGQHNLELFKSRFKDIKLSGTIGNFDGLHLGHQKLFRLAQKFKKKYSSKIGVMTFEPMPKMFFNKNLSNFRISNQKQKINLLKKFDVDFVINKKFDKIAAKKCLLFITLQGLGRAARSIDRLISPPIPRV